MDLLQIIKLNLNFCFIKLLGYLLLPYLAVSFHNLNLTFAMNLKPSNFESFICYQFRLNYKSISLLTIKSFQNSLFQPPIPLVTINPPIIQIYPSLPYYPNHLTLFQSKDLPHQNYKLALIKVFVTITTNVITGVINATANFSYQFSKISRTTQLMLPLEIICKNRWIFPT